MAANAQLLTFLAIENSFHDDAHQKSVLFDDDGGSDFVALAAACGTHYSTDCDDGRSGTTIKRYYEQTVNGYTPCEFVSHFRLSRHAVQGICEKIGNDKNHNVRGAIPLEKQVLMTLWTLGNQESFRTIGDRFGLSNRGLAHHCVVNTCRKIRTCMYDDVIAWPSSVECQSSTDEFLTRYGFPGVIGCIDGSHIPVKAPAVDRDSYINRKGFASVNLLAVCDHRLRFIYTYADCPGSMHDARVMRLSALGESLTTGQLFGDDSYHLLGDSAYPLLVNLLVPFRDNGHLSDSQTRYNVVHSAARSVIERAFGRLKGKFRRLKYLDVTRTDLAALFIDTACVLHNISLLDSSDDDGMDKVEVEQSDNDISNNQCLQQSSNINARRKRDNIMLSL